MAKKEKQIIGLTEKIYLIGKEKTKTLTARIDTGATISSIDNSLADELGWHNVIRTKVVKSASGTSRRPVVKGKVKINGKNHMGSFTLIDRSHLKYSVLIGQDVLKKCKCLIDPTK